MLEQSDVVMSVSSELQHSAAVALLTDAVTAGQTGNDAGKQSLTTQGATYRTRIAQYCTLNAGAWLCI